MIGLARTNYRGREAWSIGGVRKMLAFQAKAEIPGIGITVRAEKSAGAKISAENLHARLSGRHLHCPAGFRIFEFRAKGQIAGAFAIEHEAMVVAAVELLFLDLADALADCVRRSKIERRPSHINNLAGGNQGFVG